MLLLLVNIVGYLADVDPPRSQSRRYFHDEIRTVKLGDFGIARKLEHTTELTKTAVGTPY
jgi:serine/threonine protein kinase